MAMETLKLTNNSKVRFKNNHYNTFSLNPGHTDEGGTCPGSTNGEGGCRSKCYDKTLRRIYNGYREVEEHNTSLLINAPAYQLKKIIDRSILSWKLDNPDSLNFRIHTGGDFFNRKYTFAWRDAINKHDDVQFWTYTRSMFAVPILVHCSNLSLYISCDPVNQKEAIATYRAHSKHKNLAVAWMGNELPLKFPKDRQLLICPEVTGKIKKDKNIGACSRCRACINRPLKTGKNRHIQFPIHR
jgi:hypothetical protein